MKHFKKALKLFILDNVSFYVTPPPRTKRKHDEEENHQHDNNQHDDYQDDEYHNLTDNSDDNDDVIYANP